MTFKIYFVGKGAGAEVPQHTNGSQDSFTVLYSTMWILGIQLRSSVRLGGGKQAPLPLSHLASHVTFTKMCTLQVMRKSTKIYANMILGQEN